MVLVMLGKVLTYTHVPNDMYCTKQNACIISNNMGT